MTTRVLVLGGGHNGLVLATRLAQSGRQVTLLEQAEVLGGLAAVEEFHPGYRCPGPVADTSTFSRDVAREIGLRAEEIDTPTLHAPAANGSGLVLTGQPDADLSEADASAYREWRSFLERVRPLIRAVLHEAPPTLEPDRIGDFLGLARRGLALRRLGKKDMTELTRVGTMCAADWLNERFESRVLVEALAAPAVLSTFNGPWSAGTAANLLLHEALRSRPLEGGARGLIAGLSRAAESAGVEVRIGVRVTRIEVENGHVRGVTLASGEEIGGLTVASTCDPKQTMLHLLPPGVLDVDVEQQFRALRARGTTAQVRLALAGPLQLDGQDGHDGPIRHARIGGGHIDDLERAFDAVKYRRWASKPHLEITVPSVDDPELAPEGHHVASILVSAVPHDLEGGWTNAERDNLLATVLGRLEEHAPGARDRLVASDLATPVDIEARYATTGGHLHHGEHALDQLLMMRPAPCAAASATPIGGLYLGGSGSHPGGGLTGIPGLLCARAILRGR